VSSFDPGISRSRVASPAIPTIPSLAFKSFSYQCPCFKSFLAIDHAVVRHGPQPSVIDQNVNNSLSGFLVTNATRPALIDFDRMNRFSRRIGVEPCE
jgi:hypothetical protein